MAMQLKFFIVPVREAEAAETGINRFLRSVRVVHLHREFVAQGDNSFWSLAVEYLIDGDRPGDEKGRGARRSKIDYREVLPPEAFAVFVKLREWRKQQAAREAVPVYTIFTNEQLAAIAEKKITTKAGLEQIDGIGEARIKKYGEAVIQIMTEPNRGSGNMNKCGNVVNGPAKPWCATWSRSSILPARPRLKGCAAVSWKDLGFRPKARTGCSAAAPGSTMPGIAGPRTATGTSRAIATTT
jgi:hypothetical protein